MSREFLTRNSRLQFFAATTELLETLSRTFPDCEDTKDVLLVMKNVTTHSEDKMNESLDDWHTHLTTPLNSKKTKYAKAVERLTGRAIVFHAMAYRDVDAINNSLTSGIATRIGLFEKWNNERFTESTKEVMWNLLEMMNRECYKAKEVDLPNVPSRAEIQENIKLARSKTAAPPQDQQGASAMLSAFRDDMNALCDLWKIDAVVPQNEASVRKWMDRWSEFTAKEINQKPIRAHCVDRNAEVVLAAMREHFPELEKVTAMPGDAWANLTRLNDVSAVVNSVPAGMMCQIENMASKLAQDLQNGTINMANVNLSQIGEQVLANCSQSEMSDFAGSIEKLMPVVQSMATHPSTQQ